MPSSPPSTSAGGGPRVARRRLSRSGDFDSVYRRGHSVANRHLVLYAFSRPEGSDGPRLGLSVSRKVGDAVSRNRVKRVIREQFATCGHELGPNTDVVVIARPGVASYLDQNGSAALGERLAELVHRVSRQAQP